MGDGKVEPLSTVLCISPFQSTHGTTVHMRQIRYCFDEASFVVDRSGGFWQPFTIFRIFALF